MVTDNTEGNRNEGACLCKSILELLILTISVARDGGQGTGEDACGCGDTPECEEHDKSPNFYSKLQGVSGQGGGGRAGWRGTTEEEEVQQKVNLKFMARMDS